MRSSRLLLPVSALCLAGLLAGCSGGDDATAGAAGSTSTSSASGSPSAAAPVGKKAQRTCDVEVEVTGSVQASWKGKGTSLRMTSGPDAIYRSQHGKSQVVVYSSGKDFKTSANFTQGQQTFTTPLGDATGIDAASD